MNAAFDQYANFMEELINSLLSFFGVSLFGISMWNYALKLMIKFIQYFCWNPILIGNKLGAESRGGIGPQGYIIRVKEWIAWGE
jgi:hypothetical protein